ncbi:SigE family RNA polymerase sigma factor [Nocardioides speluncae]|uniref:SigE family RNA polymerase sigma factor n=1 Tax=Nocardioides speluncae TaxID=2670337 RepID=UPI001F0BBFE1|nr:SigE family RNA polymerase sigma factor [Nocardioides speluncae]
MLDAMTETGKRDAGGFDEFVAARSGALWRSAWLLTGDIGKAEDLLQTALGKAWPHFGRVNGDGSFEAYVRRVMFTTYVAWWRRRWNVEVPAAAVPEQAGAAVDADLRRDLVTALAALPRGQRAVVVLRYVEDLTEAQTADVLGISVGTVKSQAARAIVALRSSPALAREEDA